MFMLNQSKHLYSLNATGIKFKQRLFQTREEALRFMYDICDKKHLSISKIYDDTHDKTYICDNDVRFYIQRYI